ncbi:MAG: hypothetical protein FGM49_05595 [Candidatus Nanopelagicaceae bacterium]|nr:hypothetical protein [Candidatus Nanopelagicaceae bacterium]
MQFTVGSEGRAGGVADGVGVGVGLNIGVGVSDVVGVGVGVGVGEGSGVINLTFCQTSLLFFFIHLN